MFEKDTVKLLKECDAGVKMGISSLDDVIPRTKAEDLKKMLKTCKNEHKKLGEEIESLLSQYGNSGKAPNPIAKVMSHIKTNMKMAMHYSDATIADLITDGCNMGVKSLNKYLNEYKAANEFSKDITKRLINLEERLTVDIRDYL